MLLWFFHPICKRVFLLLIIFQLIACGGSGGDNSAEPVPDLSPSSPEASVNSPPVADAGADQETTINALIQLSGAGNDSDGSILSYSWSQVSGPTVSLENADTDSPSFIVPDVSENTSMVFELTVSDEDGATATDTITVFVIVDEEEVTTDPNESSFDNIKLNDTGVVTCLDENKLISTCPVFGMEGQDGDHGRDAQSRLGTLNKVGTGRAGFDFTRISNECVKDNHTGLYWELKTEDGGMRDKNNLYTWHNPDANTNGGDEGSLDESSTSRYVEQINSTGLCGFTDWRLPNKEELRSIVDYSANNPTIDTGTFPDYTPNFYWTATPIASDNQRAWVIYFGDGFNSSQSKFSSHHIRLVRKDND